ncbi:hypothetical protein HDV63DRAFT_198658 [Trichoderma sp. SZMC 28014]
MHQSSSSPLPPQGMPRSSSTAAINNPKVRPQPSSRIVRAQISSPIPMQDPLDKELYIRPHDTRASGYAPPPHANLSKPSMETSRPSAEFSRRRISSTPERSRSVLRTALSKIFGRKKAYRPITPLASADSEDERQDAHFSDAARDSIPAQRIPPKKIETFPISEYDRALRSHSVGPEDVMAIRSARSPVNAEYSGHSRKRNGTGSDAHQASARWVKPTGLTPRPASTTDWGSRLVDASHDPEEIGRAVTTGLKRRSRSLSFIPLIETADAPNITRRRSDEFPRGWRESYDQEAASPVSSTAPDGGDRRTYISQKSNDEEAEPVDEIDSPVKPFTFSNMPYLAEFAGNASMKITDAVGLETRIGQVENRLSLVEGLLTHARQASPGDGLANDSSERLVPPMPAWSSVFSTAARPSSHSSAQVSGTSRLSFGEIPTYIRSASQQTTKQPMFAASTLSKSVPTGSFLMDHETYNALVSTMESDRAARLALEAQVEELSRQITRLSKSIPVARADRTNDEVASPSFGQPPVLDFGQGEDDDEDLRTKKSRRSFRKAAQNEDSGLGTESGDRDYPESFATLNDEHHNSKANLPFSSSDAILSLSKLTTMHSMAHSASQQTVSQSF